MPAAVLPSVILAVFWREPMRETLCGERLSRPVIRMDPGLRIAGMTDNDAATWAPTRGYFHSSRVVPPAP